MSYQKKYYYTFQDIKKTSYTVEIWQDTTATITPEEIRGSLNPFTLEYPEVKKFETIRGSGVNLNLLSTTDRKFFNLYTADMMEYQIRFYKSGVLYWCGYLDSELYNEPFNSSKNYSVNFTGTDGFALLERLNYLDESGGKYTGLLSHWQIINNIISRLKLPYKNIYVSLSTISNEFTLTASETLFHKTFSNNQNWYNEDDEPETLRTVLENILKPYSAIIVQDQANIYIVDVNTIAKATSTTFKRYNASFQYVCNTTINLNLGDLESIGFAASDQNMSVVSGYNRQLLKYSSYIKGELIDYSETDFNTVATTTTYGQAPYRWTEKTYTSSNSWNKYNNGAFAGYVGADTGNTTETDSYLKISRYSTNGVSPNSLSFSYKKELPYIIPSGAKLQINCKAFFRTNDNLNGNVNSTDIYQGKLRCRLKIGDRLYYRNSQVVSFPTTSLSSGWANAASYPTDSFDMDFESKSIITYNKNKISGFNPIDNKWIDLKKYDTNGGFGDTLEIRSYDYLIPLNPSLLHGITGGTLTFEIYDFDIMVNPIGTTPNYTNIKNSVRDVRIKDFSIKLVDANGEEIETSDTEYVGYMNAKFKEEADAITTYQGTSVTENSIERGALIGYNSGTFEYYFLSSWTREGKTDILENLLLRSLISNYTNRTIQLTATVNNFAVPYQSETTPVYYYFAGEWVYKAPFPTLYFKNDVVTYNGNYYLCTNSTASSNPPSTNPYFTLTDASILVTPDETLEMQVNSIVGGLSYQSKLPDKVFMIVGLIQNFADNNSQVTLQEISVDNLEINKSF